MVRDRELVDRYLAQQTIFPFPSETLLEGSPIVFGIGAGNRYARQKIFCAAFRAVGWDVAQCHEYELADFISHQELRSFMEKGSVDSVPIFRQYGVNTIITPFDLPDFLAQFCESIVHVRDYDIYSCRFRVEQNE